MNEPAPSHPPRARSGRAVLAIAAALIVAIVGTMYVASRLGPGAPSSHPAPRRVDEHSLFDRGDARP